MTFTIIMASARREFISRNRRQEAGAHDRIHAAPPTLPSRPLVHLCGAKPELQAFQATRAA